MARTVDTSSTFENWRQNYNDLATDVGGLANLTTADKTSVVNAINYIMDQYFYFQDFEYDGSDGATSNTVFSGADNAGNTLAYSPGKVLVFKQGLLLRSGTDYTATNGTSITLASSAQNSDVVRFSVFTGSYENVGAASSDASVQWTLAGSTIYNHNLGGVILNSDSSLATSLGVANSIQLDGNTYVNGSMYFNAQNDLRFNDADNSHSVGFQAPTTVSANLTWSLPAADGSSGQLLSTDGSGNLSFVSSATATDVNVSANNSANETVYPVFVDGATGSQGVESDTGLTYNPSTGMLTSTGFTGALTGNVTGTATVATTVTITDNENTAESNAVVFVSGANNAGGNLGLESDGDLTYNPGTGKLTSPSFDGNGLYLTALNATNITSGTIGGARIANDAIDSQHYADHSIDNGHISDNVVNADLLDVSGNGSSGQALISDGDGSFSWSTIAGTTYDLSVPSGTTTIRLDPSSGSNDDIALTAGTDISITRNSATQLTIASTASPLTTEAVQDIVGGMFSGNTETRITATYQDGDGTIDLEVSDMTANTHRTVTAAGNTLASGETLAFTAGTGIAIAEAGGAVTITNSIADTNLTTEEVQDIVGGMFSSNTETRITATYQDGDGTIDLEVSDMTADNNDNTTYSTSWVDSSANAILRLTAGGSGSGTDDLTLVAGTAITLTPSGDDLTIASSDTTYTAGAGLDLSGSAFAIEADVREHPNARFGNNADDFILFDSDNNLLRFYINDSEMAQIDAAGNLDVENDVIAYSTSVSSDMALKENINPITDALDKIIQIGGYSFDWKDKKHGSSTGLIAQEVEKVLPDLVKEREGIANHKILNYNGIIGLLVESIKELKTELDELKSSNS